MLRQKIMLLLLLLLGSAAVAAGRDEFPELTNNVINGIEVQDQAIVAELQVYEKSQSAVPHEAENIADPYPCWKPKNDRLFEGFDSKVVTHIVNNAQAHSSYVVSYQRKRASAFLTKAALHLPTEGDVVETGCYQGGSTIVLMQTMLEFDQCKNRKLWVFDSFEGLPDEVAGDGDLLVNGTLDFYRYQRAKSKHKGGGRLFFTSQAQFMKNMAAALGNYDATRLVVTKGWFNETLRASTVEKISFLRLDGDLYDSTWQALTALYGKVVPGGYIYIDDYASFPGCRRAVDRFRFIHRIAEPLNYVNEVVSARTQMVTFEAVWWRKTDSQRQGQAGRKKKSMD